MTDNGLAALAERLNRTHLFVGRRDASHPWTEADAAIVLGRRGVFLPDGLGPVMVGMAKEIAALRDALDGLVAWLASRDATNWSPGWSEDYRNGYDTAVEEVRTALATAEEADHD